VQPAKPRHLLIVLAGASAACAIVANLGDRTLGDVDQPGGDATAHDAPAQGDAIGGDESASDVPVDDVAQPDRGAPDERIDPLDIGRTWSFKIIPNDGGTNTCDAQTSAVVGPGLPVDGAATVRYQPFCTPFAVDVIVDGDRVTAYSFDGHFSGPQVIVDPPVEEGHTWTGGAQFIWHDAGTISVPAGTFTNCWAREIVGGGGTRNIYCRGVGLARSEDPSFTAVLASKNF
jgi:hypothetical protein